MVRLLAFNAGCLGSILGQGTRSQMPQLKVRMLQLKIPHVVSKTWCTQTDKFSGFPGGASGKESIYQCRSLIPGSGRSLGGGHGNPLQYSCLENPTGRKAWRTTVHRVAKSWTWLKRLSMHACIQQQDTNSIQVPKDYKPGDTGTYRDIKSGAKISWSKGIEII